MKTITIEWLESEEACKDQVQIFTETFGDSADLTSENIREAVRVGLDIHWLAEHLLTTCDLKDAYHAACQPHHDAYEAARKPHWDAYKAAIQPHWDVYEVACGEALIEIAIQKARGGN